LYNILIFWRPMVKIGRRLCWRNIQCVHVIKVWCNSYIIIAIVPNQRLRTVRNILLLHLAIVGLMNSVLMTFFAAVVSIYGYWIGGIVTCKMYGFLESSYTAVTVWTIAALSWDKYQTIASPLHHSLSATLRKMTCF
jgi:hypothetical protein